MVSVLKSGFVLQLPAPPAGALQSAGVAGAICRTTAVAVEPVLATLAGRDYTPTDLRNVIDGIIWLNGQRVARKTCDDLRLAAAEVAQRHAGAGQSPDQPSPGLSPEEFWSALCEVFGETEIPADVLQEGIKRFLLTCENLQAAIATTGAKVDWSATVLTRRHELRAAISRHLADIGRVWGKDHDDLRVNTYVVSGRICDITCFAEVDHWTSIELRQKIEGPATVRKRGFWAKILGLQPPKTTFAYVDISHSTVEQPDSPAMRESISVKFVFFDPRFFLAAQDTLSRGCPEFR